MRKEDLIRLDNYFWSFIRVTLSISRKIAFWFTKCEPHNDTEIKKILLIKLFSESGYAHIYPIIKKLKAEWPFADVHLLTYDLNTNNTEFIEKIDPERIHKIDTGSYITYFKDVFKKVTEFAKEEFDVYFDLESKSDASAVIADLIGAKKSCGFVFNDDSFYSRKVLLTHKILYNCTTHRGLAYFSMPEAVKCDYATLKNEYANKFPTEDIKQLHRGPREFTQDEQEEIYELLNFEYPYIHEKTQFVAIAPFDNDNNIMKQWPIEHYTELIKKFVINKNIVVLIIFSLCDLFISNNGEIATFACQSKIKNIILCGPDRPNVCELYALSAETCCSPCLNPKAFNKTKCRENDCMTGLDPETVFEAADFLLKQIMIDVPAETDKVLA